MRAALIVSLVSLLLALGLGEAYLRLAGHTPRRAWVNGNFSDDNWGMADPVLGWVNRPGTFRSVEAGQAPMRFTADHARAARPADAPAPPGPPVLLLGCSFTQGYGIVDDETYAWRLSERFPHTAVENYGTGGYGAPQVYLRLKAELERRRAEPPRAVVYGLIGHQALRTVADFQWVRYLTNAAGDMVVPPHALLGPDGALVERPMEVVPPWPLEDVSALVAALHEALLAARFGGRAEQGWAATLAEIERMAALARAQSIPFAVALLDDQHVPGGKENWRRLTDGLDRAGVTRLNCVHPDYERSPATLQVGGAGHPNAVVHQYWADCMAPWLAQAGAR